MASSMDYTTLEAVKQYGDTNGSRVNTDALITAVITATSRALDQYCNQTLGQEVTSDVLIPARVAADGVLLVSLATPVVREVTALSYRVGASQIWHDVTLDTAETQDSSSGAMLRVYGDYRSIRGARLQVRVSYDGGWLQNNIPADFEFKMRRAAWHEIKLMSAPMEKTANPALGVLVIPQAWPPDLKQAFATYRRWTV